MFTLAAATLILTEIGKTTYDSLQVGQTMALASLALMNIAVSLNLRFPDQSAFGKATLSNPRLLYAFAWAFVVTVLITSVPFLQDLFATSDLTLNQWGLCFVPALLLLAIGEIAKLFERPRGAHAEPAAAAEAAAA